MAHIAALQHEGGYTLARGLRPSYACREVRAQRLGEGTWCLVMNEGADPSSSPNFIPMMGPAIHSIKHAIYDFLGRGGGRVGACCLNPKP